MTDGTTHPSEFRVTLLLDFGRPGTRAVRPLGKPFPKDPQAEQANGAAKSTGYCACWAPEPAYPAALGVAVPFLGASSVTRTTMFLAKAMSTLVRGLSLKIS